tara:strand:+ start:2501 stop:3004 length:504 start_codon:yes stop_codon:yes gene_type:complete
VSSCEKKQIMKLEVLRFNYGDDSTNGILFDITNGERKFLCYTLEDERREEKVWGETCIPEGEYCIGLRTVGGHHAKYSKRFADIHKGMLHVLDVPNFKYILIHCGNTDEHTAGCLLLGNSQVNNNIKTNGYIGNSTEAYFNVYPKIAEVLEKGQEDVTINYVDMTVI